MLDWPNQGDLLRTNRDNAMVDPIVTDRLRRHKGSRSVQVDRNRLIGEPLIRVGTDGLAAKNWKSQFEIANRPSKQLVQ